MKKISCLFLFTVLCTVLALLRQIVSLYYYAGSEADIEMIVRQFSDSVYYTILLLALQITTVVLFCVFNKKRIRMLLFHPDEMDIRKSRQDSFHPIQGKMNACDESDVLPPEPILPEQFVLSRQSHALVTVNSELMYLSDVVEYLSDGNYRIGNLLLNTTRKILIDYSGNRIELGRRQEYVILEAFITAPGHYLSREDIREIRQMHFGVLSNDKQINTCVSRVRKLLRTRDHRLDILPKRTDGYTLVLNK